MGRRSALLVGTYEYSDTSLQRLAAPGHDVESLARVLADPHMAGFDVTTFINKPHHLVGEAIGNFFDELGRDDLALLYISGHGLKDDQGRLFLPMTNSNRQRLTFTAIGAEQINDAMNSCRSRQKVLILDCCYGGAFPGGWTAKGASDVDSLKRFQGRGRVVLTASDAAQYSFEGETLSGNGSSSLFTRYLIDGIVTGKADLDMDGDISLDELYSYVYDRVVEEMPQQRPKKQEEIEGRIVIARNVGWELPGHVQNAINSPITLDRRGAVQSLAHLYRVGNPKVRERVREQLEVLVQDDSRAVSTDAARAIASMGEPAEPPANAESAPPSTNPNPPIDGVSGRAPTGDSTEQPPIDEPPIDEQSVGGGDGASAVFGGGQAGTIRVPVAGPSDPNQTSGGSTNVRTQRRRRWSLAAVIILLLGGGIWTLVGRSPSTPDQGQSVTPPTEDFCSVINREWPGLSGTTVNYLNTVADDSLAPSLQQFGDCTGVTVDVQTATHPYELKDLIAAGTAPDMIETRQPSVLAELLADGAPIRPVEEITAQNVDRYYDASWRSWGIRNGTLYAVPTLAEVKSFVWYSPKHFEENGYTTPTTYGELISLSDQIVSDGKKPWCAGVQSGFNGAWPATDWLEDFLLRQAGPDTYDQWVNHAIKFDDPKVAQGLRLVARFLKNPDYVNGGFGGATSITSTPILEAGMPILTGDCYMHKQSNSFEAVWPEGTTVGPGGDVNVFYLPPVNTGSGLPLLVGAGYAAALSDRPEVRALLYYFSTPEWSMAFAATGMNVTPNLMLDPQDVKSVAGKVALEYLREPDAIHRFDASDVMPPDVGMNIESAQLYDWLNGGQDDQTTLANIEAAWPK